MLKFVLAATLAFCASTAFSETPQQERMKACNADAGKQELKGDERKAFMKDCLSAKKEEAGDKTEGLTAQQQKMKDCNAQAKEKKVAGKERKAFMSECLKG